MARREVVLRIETVSEPETGIWCDTCLLPSIVRCVAAVVTSGGRLLHLGSYERCDSCPDDPILMTGTR